MSSNRPILLTGAGFTKNFGGLLADEMWAIIFNHDKIQKSSNVRRLMLTTDGNSHFDNFNYEYIYSRVLNDPDDKYSKDDKEAIKNAIKAAYRYQGNIILSAKCKCSSIINPFFDFIQKNISTFFTLNQDLFIEQHSRSGFLQRDLSFVGSPTVISDNEHVEKPKKLRNKDEITQIKQDIENRLKKDRTLGYIKLHGSRNWLDSEGAETLVLGIGIDKVRNLIKEPLIKWYFDLFEQLLKQQKKLLIIGYAFLDEHINKIIYEAMSKYQLKLHVVDSLSPKEFEEKMCKTRKSGIIHYELSMLTADNKRYRKYFWNNLSGYFKIKTLLDLFEKEGLYFQNVLKTNLGIDN